jgi:hypothetical protein
MDNGHKIEISGSVSDSIDTEIVLHTNMDHNPEIERFNGRLRLVFTRASGTTNDGIYYMKEI